MKRLLLATVSVFALSAGAAIADPVTLAVSALSTATSVAAAGGIANASLVLFGTTIASGAAAVAAQFAVRAALGYALNALAAKGVKQSRGYQAVNQLGPALPRQIIYGETRIGGAVFYQTLTGDDDEYLHRAIAFAGHEIDSYQAIYVNDEEVTLDEDGNVTSPEKWGGHIRILQHLGTEDQLADSAMVSEIGEWTSAHRARGVAYLYVRYYQASEFNGSVPTITAKIRGRKVHDTRTGVTAWSNNPAMCIRDYVLADYGLKERVEDINDTLFEEAADDCDVLVKGAKKYTCNGAFLLDASPEDTIRNMLSSMGGIFWNYSGDWAVLAAKYREPTLSLTQDDLRSDLQVATKHSRRDNFNSVRGQYKGPETNYQADDYPRVRSGLYLTEDGGIETASELNLLFSDNQIEAQRIARTFLRRNRQQVTVSATFGLRAMDTKVGDNVTLTVPHMGWDAKVFEVVDWKIGMQDLDIHVSMILREMDEVVFTGVVDVLEDESGNALQDESGNNLEAIIA